MDKEILEIKVKKLDEKLPNFDKLVIGDWIDLRIMGVKKVNYPAMIKGDYNFKPDIKQGVLKLRKGFLYTFKLGFACELPEGYEAVILPRSSTYKNSGLLLLNSQGVIDNSYCGGEDEWMAFCKAEMTRDLILGERYFQFRIQKSMSKIKFKYVKKLNNKNRGGFGSSGVK